MAIQNTRQSLSQIFDKIEKMIPSTLKRFSNQWIDQFEGGKASYEKNDHNTLAEFFWEYAVIFPV